MNWDTMPAQYLLQYCNVVFLCLLHIPWIWISFLNMIVYWWNLNQRHGFLDMQVSTMQLFDWLDSCASLTRWQSHLSWARRLESLCSWLGSLGLKNRVPHLIDHGWFVKLGAWGFLGSESRAQETQRPQQKLRRSGWAVVSDGPRSPATIHWSFIFVEHIQRCDQRREQWTPVKMCSTRLNSNHNYWNSQFNFLVYAPFSETC